MREIEQRRMIGKGRILTGVFTSESESVQDCEIFSKFLEAGFELYHVGINTHLSVFVQKMKKFSPQVLVLLCQGNVEAVKKLIETIKEERLRSLVRIILYAPRMGEAVRDQVHADAFAESEQELFDMVNEIVHDNYL